MEKSSQDFDPLPASSGNKKEDAGDPAYFGKTLSSESSSKTFRNGKAPKNGHALKKSSNKKTSGVSVKSAKTAKVEKKDSPKNPPKSKNNHHSDGQFGQFQKVILSTAREKLNMMMSEVYQCKQKRANLDFSNKEKLTHKILCMIAEKKIDSVHISPEEATRILGLLDELNFGEDHQVFRDYSISQDGSSDHEQGDSPFSGESEDDQKSDGPFSNF